MSEFIFCILKEEYKVFFEDVMVKIVVIVFDGIICYGEVMVICCLFYWFLGGVIENSEILVFKEFFWWRWVCLYYN